MQPDQAVKEQGRDDSQLRPGPDVASLANLQSNLKENQKVLNGITSITKKLKVELDDNLASS